MMVLQIKFKDAVQLINASTEFASKMSKNLRRQGRAYRLRLGMTIEPGTLRSSGCFRRLAASNPAPSSFTYEQRGRDLFDEPAKRTRTQRAN